ncbi:hypothetical protein PIB30_081917 [Stylosanthes scabra]|uniref:Protein kinase domain-containing protein n=1 Tax=Stylosanthes scabra TaxID=79078 RepID=A0ABU6QRY5_9FABA|nr:hypothetical protein [Stylosanthes scabra]
MASILINSPFFTLFLFFYFLSSLTIINTLSTVSISETSNQTFICALQVQGQGQSNLNCTSFPPGISLQLNPNNLSYSEIVGGSGFLCALRPPSSSNSIMGCWRFPANASNVPFKRIYHGPVIQNMDAGNSHVCGLVTDNNNSLRCWQWPHFDSSKLTNLSSIAVGRDFVCGLSESSRKVTCIGSDTGVVGREPGGAHSAIAAGFSHACAISLDGNLDCWGDIASMDQKPQGKFLDLALGENRTCALRINKTVACWGSNNFRTPQRFERTPFEAIVAKRSVFCGIVSYNFSLVCWGASVFETNSEVFENVLPGPCRSNCPCGILTDSATLCSSGMSICTPCSPRNDPDSPLPLPPPTNPPTGATNSSRWSKKMVAFLVVGCVGCTSLLLVFCFFIYWHCKGKGGRVHDSGRLDESGTESASPSPPEGGASRGILEKRLSHVISMGNGSHLEEYTLQVLLEATNNFSEDKKIGTGSFGSVYHATLQDGKEVAIKRAENSPLSPSNALLGATRRQEDKDSAFVNELENLSRLHHKNLVRLIGFYEDSNERILVYEYMNNGSLNEHLHKIQSSALMSWAVRIKVALDAARGIEYLHQYATPPIIHRDIKSSNILLDSKWTAKVSDFGLSLMGPEDEESHLSLLAAGTVGYMDPEYYRLQMLTTKSDVYSFGVVLLELLSGHKAIHKNENGVPRNVVDFVVPYINQDEIHRVLDRRMPQPTPFEIEAVAYVGYLAADCVRLEGRDRPTMTEVANYLEKALAVCLAKPSMSRSTTNTSSE